MERLVPSFVKMHLIRVIATHVLRVKILQLLLKCIFSIKELEMALCKYFSKENKSVQRVLYLPMTTGDRSTQILNQTLLRNADSLKLFYIQTKETRLWSQTGLGTNLYHLGKLLDPLEFTSVG